MWLHMHSVRASNEESRRSTQYCCGRSSSNRTNAGRCRVERVRVRSISVLESLLTVFSAWVLKYGDLKNEISSLSHAEDVFKANGLEFPSIEDVPFQYRIVNQDPPLGASLDEYARVNIPSTFNSTDPAETPLQFTYEAANCRLFYQPEDIFDGTKIWERVVDVAWGSGKCVSGSSINTDDTISSGAYDTLPLSPIAYSKVPMDAGLPGFVPNSRAS
jgi:hypothetical protein